MMTYTRRKYRLGTTATAAVLALSSTQLLAQEAPSTETPAVEAPAGTVTATPAPPAPAADPLAPTAEPVTAADSTEASAAPADAKTAPTRSKSAVKSAVKTARTSESSSTKAPEPDVPTQRPAVEPSENSNSSPLDSMEPAEIASIPGAKPLEKAKLDEAVPLAGGAGAVILALAGAGMAIRRRKLRQDDDGFEQEAETAIADEPMAEPEPLWDPPVREPAAMAPAKTANDVFEDFDTSKFGPHVQAAYRGPTPENPSLSLRKRLKIAGELDRRERKSGQIAEASKLAVPARKPIVATAKAPQSLSFSLSGTPAQVKWPEKQY